MKALPAWISSVFRSDSTSLRLRVQNSSRRVTSSKYLNVYSSAACRSDSQPWFSANIRIPRQFDGSSCFSRNSEHACLTPTEHQQSTAYYHITDLCNTKNTLDCKTESWYYKVIDQSRVMWISFISGNSTTTHQSLLEITVFNPLVSTSMTAGRRRFRTDTGVHCEGAHRR